MLLVTIVSDKPTGTARLQLGTDERPANKAHQLIWGYDAFYGKNYSRSGVVIAESLDEAVALVIEDMNNYAPSYRAVKAFQAMSHTKRRLNFVCGD